MRNAKSEFETVTLIHKNHIKCAYITHGNEEDEHYKVCMLKVGYSKEDYDKFMESLDFEYKSSFGSQELFGYIWLNDDTWYERYEYDGAEMWDYKSTPPIPNELF